MLKNNSNFWEKKLYNYKNKNTITTLLYIQNSLKLNKRDTLERNNNIRNEENKELIYSSTMLKNNIQSPSHNININYTKLPNNKSPLTSNQNLENDTKLNIMITPLYLLELYLHT